MISFRGSSPVNAAAAAGDEQPPPPPSLQQLQLQAAAAAEKRLPTRAQRLWEQLSNHVRRGFFTRLLNQDMKRADDNFAAITSLWEDAQKYRKPAPLADVTHPGRTPPTTFDSRLGLGGLSLDHVPNIKVSVSLRNIAKALGTSVDEADFYTAQIQYQRAWKLMLLGLAQAECLARYLTMMNIVRVMKSLNETLLDQLTRDSLIRTLLNIMISDERRENRLKAVYVLGELGFFLGAVREHDNLLYAMYRELSKRLLEIQVAEKSEIAKTGSIKCDDERRALKISLFHAIGKFSCSSNKYSSHIEDMTVYLMYEEFANGEAANVKGAGNKGMYVVKALLDIMNNQIRPTEYNRVYLGALFKKFVHPLMKQKHGGVQMEAVQFVSNWLPVHHEDAILTGLEVLDLGLESSKELGVEDFHATYQKSKKQLQKKQRQETSRLAMKTKLLRQLLQPPGTYAKMEPVKDYPGFFADMSSSLLHSRGCAVYLPVHPRSLVTITRLLPTIPGVPSNATTVPPVFMDPAWAEKQAPPQSKFEWLERNGKIPGLPIGYVRGAGPVVSAGGDAGAGGGEAWARPGLQGSARVVADTGDLPPGYTRVPPRVDATDERKVPLGFSTTCPFPGVDIEKIDHHKQHSTAIYSAGAHGSAASGGPGAAECPDGFTFDRHPVLWPSRNQNLKTAHDTTDFPLHAPVLLDIIQPNSQELQRTLCKVASINKTLTAVSVQNDTVQGDPESSSPLAVGTMVNVYVQPRHGRAWLAINLEVVDDDYTDDLSFGQKRLVKSHSGSSMHNLAGPAAPVAAFGQVPDVVPAGFSAKGQPYFPPPVNLPPVPAGYTPQSTPYFGKSASIKPAPAALTNRGERLYSAAAGGGSRPATAVESDGGT